MVPVLLVSVDRTFRCFGGMIAGGAYGP
jgi:hypothetical protein